MKPVFTRLTSETNDLISIKRYQLPHFYKRWFYHEEPEIIYVVQSEGKSIIGDSIGRFSPGDLLILGANLPHFLLNDPKYFKTKSREAEAYVIHINRGFMQNGFMEFDELKPIRALLTRAKRGLYIRDRDFSFLPKLIKIFRFSGLERIQAFLGLMKQIIEHDDIMVITGDGYKNINLTESNKRIVSVYKFITSSFDQKITLTDMAEKACMTPPAFCAYFKRTTGKTPFEFLNDTRIAYACKLLAGDALNISQVALECGFLNLSYFNRQFRNKMGLTPRAYKKNFTSLGTT